MGITKLFYTGLFISFLSACASTDLANTAENSSQQINHTVVVTQNSAASLAGEGFLCTLADPHATPSDRCRELANMASRPVQNLTVAESATTEQISERIGSRARTERISLNNRTALVRWFDLATGAAREAQLARSGSLCRSVENCSLTHHGVAPLEELEEAARLDSAQIRAHSQFTAVFNFLPQAEEWSADAEASVWILLSHRVDTVASSRPEVRAEALASLVALLESMRLPQNTGASPASATVGAHRSEAPLQTDTVVQTARSLIAERLAAITARIVIPALRTESERMIADLRH